MPIRATIISLIIILGTAGCGLIYKQNIQQGNALEQEDLDELYVGMNRRQVLFVFGTPSIRDPFHQDRWDYVQTYSRRGGNLVQRTVTLRFENDALAEIIGADNPIDAPIEESAEIVEEEEQSDEEKGREEKYQKAKDVLEQGSEDDF